MQKPLKIFKEKIVKHPKKKPLPIIFVSYHNEELLLAEFVADILRKRYKSKVYIFVAKRSIHSGDDPSRTILIKNLCKARTCIAICSKKSISSGWVWWESASIWAKKRSVHPLFVNLTPKEFGDPIALLFQGGNYFIRKELENALVQAVKNAGIYTNSITLNAKEISRLNSIKQRFHRKNDEEQSKKAKTPLEQFRDFLNIKLHQADAMVKNNTLNKIQVLKWKKQVFDGIRVALGRDIQDRDIKYYYQLIEEGYKVLVMYDGALDQLRKTLGQWRKYTERIKNLVYPEHLSAQFGPRDLIRYE